MRTSGCVTNRKPCMRNCTEKLWRFNQSKSSTCSWHLIRAIFYLTVRVQYFLNQSLETESPRVGAKCSKHLQNLLGESVTASLLEIQRIFSFTSFKAKLSLQLSLLLWNMLSHDFCCEIKVCAKIYVWNAYGYLFCDLIGPYRISVTAGICMSPDGQRYSLLCRTVKSLPPAFRNQWTHNYNPIYLIMVTTLWCISNWNNCQCLYMYTYKFSYFRYDVLCIAPNARRYPLHAHAPIGP